MIKRVHKSASRRPDKPTKEVAALINRNVAAIHQTQRTDQIGPGCRVAAVLIKLFGSWAMVVTHAAWFALWVLANTLPSPAYRFDPFPFSFLTLVVSLEAIFLSCFILIAQNRQDKVNEQRAELDLQINLLAEQESTKILVLLEKIGGKLGVDIEHDEIMRALEQPTSPQVILEHLAASNKQERESGKSTRRQQDSDRHE